MNKILLLIATLLCAIAGHTQLLTWTPPFPTENDAAQTLIITVDATKGNKGLQNYSNTGDVYVHIGVITSKSAGASDWKYAKFTWGTTNAAAKATSVSANKWQYTITGSLRTFFGITDATETIQKIAILFRSGNGNVKQTNSDGSDMYIPVYNNSTLAARIEQPFKEPRYVPVPEVQSWTVGSTFTVQGVANQASNLKLYHNNTVIASAVGVTSLSATATVSAQGQQQLVVEATAGGVTKYDTVNIFVAPATSPTAALPAGLRDGINYGSDGTSATLVLHAPGKQIVTLIGDFNNWTESTQYIMNRTPDGSRFWMQLTGLTRGTEYGFQYVVDNSIRIADPYVQKVLDPWNDQHIPATTYPNLKPYPTGKTTGIVGVLQTGATPYNWTVTNFNRPDKRSLVIYELLVRDFVAAHDWKTLQDTLSYFKRLGINAIEIMPFNEFEGNLSWGYNPDFYFAPDKYYGTQNALKSFIDACHAAGIAVIMDVALNHQFGLSPLVQLYWDAANNRPAANSPWFNQTPTHPFNVGYDMNHESAATQAFTSRVIEHWLTEYKIDGFRFDLSKGFTQKNSGENVTTWSQYDANRITTWKKYYDTVQTKSSNAYVILEHFADNSEEKELAEYGMLLWGNMNHNYTEAAMGWLNNSNFSGAIHTERGWSKPHLVSYMESHDEERMMYKLENYGNASGSYSTKTEATALKRVELSAAFFFTIPGPKMLWQFGEVGYDYSTNHSPIGTVSNDCRVDAKPIRWDYMADPNRRHVYDLFSNLISLRFHPWYKDAFMSNRVDYSLNGAFKWIRVTTDTSNVVVVGNFGVTPTEGSVTFQNGGTWYDYLNNLTYTATGSAQSFTLQPGEFRVYVNRNVRNLTSTPVGNVPWAGNDLAVHLYPNPAAAAFHIEVEVPQSGLLQVDLLNTVGQRIATLQKGTVVKGKHQLVFNRKAIPVSGGHYYLQVQTKGGTKTVQVTLQ